MGTHAPVTHTFARQDMGSRDGGIAEEAANGPWVERLARAGLVTRGLLYLLVGILALQVARGHKSENPDNHGALAALARQPLGKLVLAGVAVGFLAYAAWRLADAIFDADGEGSDVSGWAKRAADLARGLLYLGFFVTAVRLITGSSGEDQTKESDITAAVLRAPLGRVVVVLVGLAIIGGGLWNGWRAVSRKYRKKLRTWEMNEGTRKAVTVVATIGMAARMVVFLLIGTFLVRAAVRYDASQAVGVDGALLRLADRPYGPALLALVASGLFTFGLYSFVEARYRRIGGGAGNR